MKKKNKSKQQQQKPYTPNWYKEVNGPEQEDWKFNICRVITYKVWPQNHFLPSQSILEGAIIPLSLFPFCILSLWKLRTAKPVCILGT